MIHSCNHKLRQEIHHALASRARVLVALFAILPAAGHPDTPLGWIYNNNPAAYTLPAQSLEANLGALAVNDTLDFLDIREDLLAGNQRLVGDSGNLSGAELDLSYGIQDWLTLSFSRRNQSLTVDLGEINSVNLVDIDNSLDSSLESLGLKWRFFEGGLLNDESRRSAAALEISMFRSKSDPFDVVLDQINLDNLTVFFRDPQTFSVTDLEDDGWQARLLYTTPLEQLGIGTVWLGIGETDASSATTSDVPTVSVARVFEQQFNLEESYLYLGVSLDVQLTPRIPLTLSYQYIDVTDSFIKQFPENPSSALPGFLRPSSGLAEDSNHLFQARLSYWITPELNLGIRGNLYSNQFLGEIPHFNNPLSGSFASQPYGFAGVELGYKFAF